MNNTKGIVRVRCINKLELRVTETLHLYREDWAHSILQLEVGTEGAAENEMQRQNGIL